MDVINGMFLGAIVGLIIAVPAFVSEIMRQGKNLPLLMDVHACWRRQCTPEETFFLSLFTHLIASMGFGGLYAFFVLMGWGVHDFRFLSVLFFGFVFFLVIGFIVLPIAGLGIFAKKEGRRVWLELMFTHLFLSGGFWLAYEVFPVFLPR